VAGDLSSVAKETYGFASGANRRSKHQNQSSIGANETFPRANESSIGANEGSICASGGSIGPNEGFSGANEASIRARRRSICADGRVGLMFKSSLWSAAARRAQKRKAEPFSRCGIDLLSRMRPVGSFFG
jgi:hypothetical protein